VRTGIGIAKVDRIIPYAMTMRQLAALRNYALAKGFEMVGTSIIHLFSTPHFLATQQNASRDEVEKSRRSLGTEERADATSMHIAHVDETASRIG